MRVDANPRILTVMVMGMTKPSSYTVSASTEYCGFRPGRLTYFQVTIAHRTLLSSTPSSRLQKVLGLEGRSCQQLLLSSCVSLGHS